MSGRRRRSESLWDRKEDPVPQNETKEFHPSGGSPKRSNSEVDDVFMSDDFNENMLMDNDNNSDRHRMKSDPAFDEWENRYTSRPSDNSYDQPYRGRARGVGGRDRNRSRSRSWSPHRTRDTDRERGGTRGLARSRSRSRSRSRDRGGRARSPSRSGSNPQTKGSDGYRKDTAREEARDYHRSHRSGYDDQDHRRQSNQITRQPCRFFSMGRCNRSNCKFSHDLPKSGGYEGRSRDNDTALTGQHPPQDHDFPNNFDDNNKSSWNDQPPSWNNLGSGVSYSMGLGSNKESHDQMFHSYGEPFNQDVHNMASQFPSDLNGNGSNLQLNVSAQASSLLPDKEGGKPLETFKNNIPQVVNETIASTEQVPQVSSLPQNLNLANALDFLYSLPTSATSGGPVDSMKVLNESIKTSVPVENQTSNKPVGNLEVNENKIAEKPKTEEDSTNLGKSEVEGKVEEGNIGNDEKAMRQFKIALVEFVKEILKPTWKEGKMSREVYKTIVKKVVEKVTSTIQGVQIPRTQEKIDQYLAFSKSKITKLVEAYVGRLVKA